MQVKVYIPKVIEVPSEYLPALAKRAADSLGDRAGEVSATRGHLVRQAVQDGLLRDFDDLVAEDGTVDLAAAAGGGNILDLTLDDLGVTEFSNFEIDPDASGATAGVAVRKEDGTNLSATDTVGELLRIHAVVNGIDVDENRDRT